MFWLIAIGCFVAIAFINAIERGARAPDPPALKLFKTAMVILAVVLIYVYW